MTARFFSILLFSLASGYAWGTSVTGADPELNSSIEAIVESLTHLGNAELAELITNAMQSHGFYESTASIQGSGHARSIRISRGKPIIVNSIRIDIDGPAAQLEPFKKLIESPGISTGQALSHDAYEQLKSRLSATASDLGFFQQQSVEGVIEIDRDQYRADIRLVLQSGERSVFGAIQTPEEYEIKPEVLKQWAPFKLGDPYDAKLLEQFSSMLYGAGFFDSVHIAPIENETTQASGVVPVEIIARYKPEFFGAIGLGVSTDSGPHLSFSLDAPHSHSDGHSAKMKIEAARHDQSIGFQWRVPRANDPTRHYSDLSLGYRQYQSGAIPTRSTNIGVDLSDMTPQNWRRELYGRSQFDQFGENFANATQQTSLGLRLSRDQIPSLRRAMQGRYINIEVSGSNKNFLSDVDMFKVEANGYWIDGRSSKDRFLYRAKVGALTTDDFGSLSPSQRYFAGGDRSVRGYRLEAISPLSADGTEGGKTIAVASAEYEHMLQENIGIFVFSDAAAVQASDNQWLNGYSAGAGVRWFSPVGPVSLSLGHGYTDLAEDYRVHFTIGSEY